MNNLFKKQQTELCILLVLALILAAVLYGQFFLKPIMAECSSLEKEIIEQELYLSTARSDIVRSETIAAENAQLYSDIRGITGSLYPMMAEEDFDNIVTEYIRQSGLRHESLSAKINQLPDSQICVLTAEYQMGGSYRSLTDLLELLGNQPAIRIDNLRFESRDSDNPAADNENSIIADITLSAYMYMEN